MNYWNIDCKHCGQKMRIQVGDDRLGKEVLVKCPNCKMQTETTIGVSRTTKTRENNSEVPSHTIDKILEIFRLIEEDPQISELVSSIREEGFQPFLALGLKKIEEQERPSKSKVDKEGNVVEGTFTKQDKEDFLKSFRIKLE